MKRVVRVELNGQTATCWFVSRYMERNTYVVKTADHECRVTLDTEGNDNRFPPEIPEALCMAAIEQYAHEQHQEYLAACMREPDWEVLPREPICARTA